MRVKNLARCLSTSYGYTHIDELDSRLLRRCVTEWRGHILHCTTPQRHRSFFFLYGIDHLFVKNKERRRRHGTDLPSFTGEKHAAQKLQGVGPTRQIGPLASPPSSPSRDRTEEREKGGGGCLPAINAEHRLSPTRSSASFPLPSPLGRESAGLFRRKKEAQGERPRLPDRSPCSLAPNRPVPLPNPCCAAVLFPRSDLLVWGNFFGWFCGGGGFRWGFAVVSGNAGGNGKSRGSF